MRAEKPRATITHRFTLRIKTRYQRTDEIDEKVCRKSNKKTVTRCFENCAREIALYIVRDRRWSSGGRIFFPLGRDQARSVQTHITYVAPNAVSSFLLFCHCLPCLSLLFASFFLSRSVSFPRSFRYTFVCVRVRVCVYVYVRASRFGCVTFAACASTKLNAGKSSARNISRGNVHLSCGYRGTRTLLGAGPVSEISKTVRKYVGVKATKVCCEATTEIKVRGT